MRVAAASLLVVLLTPAGCIQGGEPATSGTSAAGTTSAAASTDGTDGSSSTGAPNPTTGEVAGQCDLFKQDCHEGAKCVPYDSMQTGVVDERRCVEIAGNPGQAGDPCVADGGIVGLDDCDLGLVCWQLDPDGHGTCIPLCKGSLNNPTCDEGLLCDVASGGLLPLCLMSCDPLSPACPTDQICIPSGTTQFVCDGDVSGDGGAFGDPCEFVNVCNAGLLCLSAPNVPGCVTAGCCSSYCDLDAPVCPAPEQECIPYHEMGAAPPGLEDVGFCGLAE